jgi:hypothetical protein
MSYVRYYEDDVDEYDNNYSDEHESSGLKSDDDIKELESQHVPIQELRYELDSPKESEKLFLEDLGQHKLSLWCHSCLQELQIIEPTIMKIVHHFRQGGTTYYTSGKCPQCKKSIWKYFRFI